eukprot:PLAT10659.1.p2 GENE.PLAT10659.1~~PLAT10659.1.p2  ORF type:complete len:666 (+),score=352.56 PLAT10659.1:3-2000(+)
MYVDAHSGSAGGSAGLHGSSAAASLSPGALAKRLWGDAWYDDECGAFVRRPPADGAARSFVSFVLEPLYKLYSQLLGEEPEDMMVVLSEYGVRLKRSEMHMDPRPLTKAVMRQFLGAPTGFVDMCVAFCPDPVVGGAAKLRSIYTGSLEGDVAECMLTADARGPLVVHVAKLIAKPDASSFLALARVMSGTVEAGDAVRVLGEAYSFRNEEDSAVADIGSVSLGQARWLVQVSAAPAGNIVLLDGLDAAVSKTATVCRLREADGLRLQIFRPLALTDVAAVKIAVEPLNPAELPKMEDGLRKLSMSYPALDTFAYESGEHVLYGTGELYVDCAMHDLRHMYSGIEVKVADPVVRFCETVSVTSSLRCFAATTNKLNKLTMVAEPLDKGLAEDIEFGAVKAEWDTEATADFLQTKYGWDAMASSRVWAFGPDAQGPNVLLDDTLIGEVDEDELDTVRGYVVNGFHWACREGPLCDEPIRATKFKLMDAVLAPTAVLRGGGQFVPTTRRVCYSSFLMASPRLMEPIYAVEMQVPADLVASLFDVLARRRGHIIGDEPIPGSPHYRVHAYLPVMDSFGFETDLRVHTQGMAFCQQVFDHWAEVPGDPLDTSIVLRPLEPSPPPLLAHDFMVKTRRRKGLDAKVNVAKYFDDPMLYEMAKEDAELRAYF